jgi:hypothetical protein
MPITTVAPFALVANTPVTVTSALVIEVQNLSSSTVFVGEVGATTVSTGLALKPNATHTFTFGTATAIDIVSPITLPAGEVRVARIS